MLVCHTATALPPAALYKATLLHPVGFTNSDISSISGAFQVGGAYGPSTGNQYHAILWNSTAQSAIDLTPAGRSQAYASDIDGNTQVGGADGHAGIWHGSAASFVDLHSIFYLYTGVNAVSGNTQVGTGGRFDTGNFHALLWHGTAASITNLHPAGFVHSEANDVDGDTQVGNGFFMDGFDLKSHALIWHGSAASYVDVHPNGFTHSRIEAISGSSQVGYGQINFNGGPTRALLWNGTADNVVNLHPAGFDYSYAHGVFGDTQVGSGLPAGTFISKALAWHGTADSVINLHQYLADLPINMTQSSAHAIDASGIIVGSARDSANREYAVMWTPIPEPASPALIAIALTAYYQSRPRTPRKN
jgi:hypothetical protein